MDTKERQLQDLKLGANFPYLDCAKCRALEWKVLEKDHLIDELNEKIRNVQTSLREKLHTFIDQLDLGIGGPAVEANHNLPNCVNAANQNTNKRINIS